MAVFNLQIPNIKSFDFNDENNQRAILEYLFTLNDKLNYALNNLDFGNFDRETYVSLSSIREDKENIQDMLTSIREGASADTLKVYNKLRDSIISTASQITTDYTTLFNATDERISSMATEVNTAKAEIGSLSETFTSRLEQTARELSASVTEVSEAVTSKQESFQNEVETYIRFSLDGLTLGKSDSQFQTKLDNTKLAFVQGGVEVAYISNNQLYITAASITDSLTIGNENTGYYVWVLESNSSLSLVRR